jgi:hypothetical protein
MEFIRKGWQWEQSDCKAYTVVKIGDGDNPTYEAWHGKEQLEVGLPDAESARAHCRAHLEFQISFAKRFGA